MVGALLVQGQTTRNLDSLNSPRLGLRGSHHLPPYSIFCSFPLGPHPNGFSSWDPQVGVLKFPHLGLSWLWRHITWRANLWLRWGLKQSYSPCCELSNYTLHVVCKQGNQVDSWLLVVRSQIANLIPGLSFAHNLCFKCPNGRCKPIVDIYVSITLWMHGLQIWITTFMPQSLETFGRKTCPILFKGLCLQMVEDSEAKGREEPWLHMGILQGVHWVEIHSKELRLQASWPYECNH